MGRVSRRTFKISTRNIQHEQLPPGGHLSMWWFKVGENSHRYPAYVKIMLQVIGQSYWDTVYTFSHKEEEHLGTWNQRLHPATARLVSLWHLELLMGTTWTWREVNKTIKIVQFWESFIIRSSFQTWLCNRIPWGASSQYAYLGLAESNTEEWAV